MEKMPNFRLIELMVTIVDRGRGAKVVDLYRTEHLHFNYMCLGMGTANSEILDYFGLSETEKDIILTMIPDCKIPDLIQKASGRFELARAGKGILFTVPLSGVSGQVQRVLCKPEYLSENIEVKKMEETTRCDLILTILNRGYTDKVMAAAKRGGARGGTALHARRVGFEDVENFLGFTIQPEKEIIAILAPRSMKADIMQEINKEAGLATECQGVLFSLPINDIMGIDFGEMGKEPL